MKNPIPLLILSLILVSFIAGFVTHCATNKKQPAIQPQPVIINQKDVATAKANDSLKRVNYVITLERDSLKKQLTLIKKYNENFIIHIDSLPFPTLYREIADFYNRKQ